MGPGMMGRMMDNVSGGIPATQLPDSASRSARLVARYCGQCHGIPAPGRLSASEWPATLERMVDRMEHMEDMGGMMRRMMEERMGGMETPSAEEQRVMLGYLQSHALRAASREDLPDGGPGKALFTRTCSGCHALPDPGQYPPDSWPAVVQRMRDHMRTMDVGRVTDEQADSIIGYLKRAAEGSRSNR